MHLEKRAFQFDRIPSSQNFVRVYPPMPL